MLRSVIGLGWPRRAGALVEIRSKEEILATLDERGMLDGLPFMPEMLEHCGKQFPVAQVAHKTCDTIHQSGMRRMKAAVHLEGLRCNGAAHGGCQAGCMFFWKEAWLKPASGQQRSRARAPAPAGCSTDDLQRATLQEGSTPEDVRYQCQITRLPAATHPWSWWNPRHYFLDVATGNWSLTHVLKVLTLACVRRLIRFNLGVRILISLYDTLARLFGMSPFREIEHQAGPIPKDAKTPTGELRLSPGDWVRVRSRSEILATLNAVGRNRGMHFDPEMVRYCDGSYKVGALVTKIIHEPTGRMMAMKNPCVVLDGVVCKSEYSNKRLMCPRAITPYWRSIWLEKTAAPPANRTDAQ